MIERYEVAHWFSQPTAADRRIQRCSGRVRWLTPVMTEEFMADSLRAYAAPSLLEVDR